MTSSTSNSETSRVKLSGMDSWLPPRDRPWERDKITQLPHERESRQWPTIVTARLAQWRDVGRVHESTRR